MDDGTWRLIGVNQLFFGILLVQHVLRYLQYFRSPYRVEE